MRVPARVSTTRGNPTVGGPLVRFLFENPHFPRGYRVGSTSNSPTRYFSEWVNKSTFFVIKLYDSVWKRCFLIDTIRIGLRWCTFSETSWKRSRLHQKSIHSVEIKNGFVRIFYFDAFFISKSTFLYFLTYFDCFLAVKWRDKGFQSQIGIFWTLKHLIPAEKPRFWLVSKF